MKQIFVILCLLGIAPSFAQPTAGLQPLNGTQLYVKTLGTKEPLIIVHGGPGMNHTYLTPHLDALSRYYKIIYYDQRASGRSATPSADSLSLKYFADDIEAIRLSLGVMKINLFTHSWGAIPAVKYALAYPDRVGKMILCNPVPLSHEYDSVMFQRMSERTMPRDSTDRSIIIGSQDFKDGSTDAYRRLLLLAFRHSFYYPSKYSKLDMEMPANFIQASQALSAGLGKELEQYDYYDAVKSFKFPVLIIHGEYDAIPLEAMQKLKASLPGSRLVVMKRAGHFVFIEQNGKVAKEVEGFLK